jgi:hypothetical protein
MSFIVALPCKCGREVRATNPRPGSILRCIYCGAEHVYRPEGEPETKERPASRTDLKIEGFEDGPLICKKCGGELKVRYTGPKGTDRIAVCLYCKTKMDLPEKRGVTKEEVIERPGEQIFTKVTKWEEVAGRDMEFDPDQLGLDPDLFEDGEVGTITLVDDSGDDLEFDSLDELRAHLEKSLPKDEVAEMFENISLAKSGSTVKTKAFVSKSSKSPITRSKSVTIIREEDDSGVLSWLKDLFKKKR